MKKTALLISGIMLTGIFILQGSGVFNGNTQLPAKADELFYPASVKKVIDQKCYGCHSVKGQSQDAKDAIMWDDLPSLEKSKVISSLDAIIGVLEDGSMPPEDVIKKYPEAKLLDDERKLLHSWAEAKSDSLLK